MILPRFYATPVPALENSPVSGDDLTVTLHFMRVIETNEKNPQNSHQEQK